MARGPRGHRSLSDGAPSPMAFLSDQGAVARAWRGGGGAAGAFARPGAHAGANVSVEGPQVARRAPPPTRVQIPTIPRPGQSLWGAIGRRISRGEWPVRLAMELPGAKLAELKNPPALSKRSLSMNSHGATGFLGERPIERGGRHRGKAGTSIRAIRTEAQVCSARNLPDIRPEEGRGAAAPPAKRKRRPFGGIEAGRIEAEERAKDTGAGQAEDRC